ncbi:hypothetical protein ABK040_006142 [Willaertia magna]
MRETQHLIIETSNGSFFIVSSLSRRKDTQLITIERYTGQLIYNAQPNIDLFHSTQDALKYISKGKKNIKSVTRCNAIIGYQVIGPFAYLIIVTKVSLDLILPPNHKVYTIKETETIKITLGYPSKITKAEIKNCDLMSEFQLKNLHFYCETYDLTRPFPSTHSQQDYTEEFVWNEHLTESFKKIRMRSWCCVLLQGVAQGRNINCSERDVELLEKSIKSLSSSSSNNNTDNHTNDNNKENNNDKQAKQNYQYINLCIICRKSCLNPGTRYFARGLNDKSSPGNEYEVEQVLWRNIEGNITFSSYVWRRGTVPIHWSSQINSAVQDANIVISEKPYENIDIYYKRLIDRYNQSPITIINLLRAKEVHPEEANLTFHFKESLKVVKKLIAIDQLEMLEFDWHTIHKVEGVDGAVKKLWELSSPKIRNNGVSTGILRVTSNNAIVDMKLWKKQNGIIRVNCADSLDRTNLVCFFISIQVIAEQCRQLGVSLCDPNGDFSESYKSLDYSLQQVRDTFDPNILLKLAEIYVNVGDVCAKLYTNTVAMHTSPMREFAQHLGAAPNNTKLIVERRIQNVLKDKVRQQQYEMFLGLNFSKYFPSHLLNTKHGEIRYVSNYPTYIFKSIPKEVSYNITEERALIRSNFPYHWVCQRDYDFVEVQIYLPFFCRVTELALTIRRGLNDNTSPSKMDVFVGTHLDNMVMGFQELNIPRCEDLTKLLYTLPPQISGIPENCTLYDFEVNNVSPIMRVVRVVFYGIPPCTCMTIPQIQVFGVQDRYTQPREFYLELLKVSSQQEVKQVLDTLERQQLEKSKKKALEIKALEKEVLKEEEAEKNISMVNELLKDETAIEFSPTIIDSSSSVSDFDKSSNASSTRTTTRRTSIQSNNMHSSTSQLDLQSAATSTLNNNNNNSIVAQKEALYSNAVLTSLTKKQMSGFIFDDYFEQPSQEDSPHNLELFLEKSKFSSDNYNTYTKLLEITNEQDETLKTIRNDKNLALEKYLEIVKTKAQSPSLCSLTFTDTLELELARLKLFISSSDRDKTLLNNGYKVDRFDPNNYVYSRDPKVEKSIRNKLQSSTCHLCKTGIKLRKHSCRYCRHSFCKNCISKNTCDIIEFNWKNSTVCIECFTTIEKQKEAIEEIQKQLDEDKTKSQQHSFENISRLFTELYPPISQSRKKMDKHEKETILSEFPSSGILSSVETSSSSSPIEMILFPPDILPKEFWYSTNDTKEVTIIIVLQAYARLSKIVLLVDPLGYNEDDAPKMEISIAERLPTFQSVGLWEIPISKPNDTIEYKLLNTTTPCRLVQLKLKLPDNNLQNDNLQNNTLQKAILHLGRVLIYGQVVNEENLYGTIPILSSQHQLKLEEILKTKLSIQRTQLKTDSKYIKEFNTLDVTLLQASNIVSGFRINVTRNQDNISTQVKHIRVSFMLSDDNSNELNSQIVVENRIIIPKVETGTSLIYEFSTPHQKINVPIKIVRFEFLSTYGSHLNELSCPQVFLFTNTL